MEDIILKFKKLVESFDYYEFISLLKDIDSKVLSGKISEFNNEFLYYFEFLMELENDSYVVDGKFGTLGHYLIEDALLSKEKLSPTLVMYFFLEQKKRADLEKFCNFVTFTYSKDAHMAIFSEEEGLPTYYMMNVSYYSKIKDADTYNYQVMHDVLHEITHIYQQTRIEETNSSIERLTYYDNLIGQIAIKEIFGSTSGPNIIAHESLMIEITADEQADITMIILSHKHPEYFSEEVISRFKDQYLEKCKYEFYENPRSNLRDYLSYLKKTWRKNEAFQEHVNGVMEKLDLIELKMKPIIEELEKQGISDKASGLRYNIFLHSLCSYSEKGLVVDGEVIQNNNL